MCLGTGHEAETHVYADECKECKGDPRLTKLNATGLSLPEKLKGIDGNWYTICGRNCQQDRQGITDWFKESQPCLKYCDKLGIHADPLTGDQYPDEKAMDRGGQGMGLNKSMHIHIGINELYRMGVTKAMKISSLLAAVTKDLILWSDGPELVSEYVAPEVFAKVMEPRETWFSRLPKPADPDNQA